MSSAAVPYSWDEGRWRGQIRSPAGGEAMSLAVMLWSRVESQSSVVFLVWASKTLQPTYY